MKMLSGNALAKIALTCFCMAIASGCTEKPQQPPTHRFSPLSKQPLGSTSQYEAKATVDELRQAVPPEKMADFFKKHYAGGEEGWKKSELERCYWSARELMFKGKFREAIQLYTRGIDSLDDPKQRALYLTKDMVNYKLSWMYANRAYCYCRLKLYKSAIPDYDKAIELRPDYNVNYINRATAYRLTGRPDLAGADLLSAGKLPENQLPAFIRNN